MKTNTSVVRQVLDLEKKTPAQLRKLYNNLFQDKCHYNATKEQMVPKLAYRLQELAFGGLDELTKAKLESIANGGSAINKAKHADLYQEPRFDVSIIA